MINNITSKTIAKKRLQNILYFDRTNEILDENLINLMKKDIASAVSKYMFTDKDNVIINIKSNNDKDAIITAEVLIKDYIKCIRKANNDN